jgi:hypothetical protein
MKIRAFLHLFSFAAILPLSLTVGKRDRAVALCCRFDGDKVAQRLAGSPEACSAQIR